MSKNITIELTPDEANMVASLCNSPKSDEFKTYWNKARNTVNTCPENDGIKTLETKDIPYKVYSKIKDAMGDEYPIRPFNDTVPPTKTHNINGTLITTNKDKNEVTIGCRTFSKSKAQALYNAIDFVTMHCKNSSVHVTVDEIIIAWDQITNCFTFTTVFSSLYLSKNECVRILEILKEDLGWNLS